MSNAALQVSGLSKSFGTRKLFENVDVQIVPGEVVALVGPSGSGKTTFFRCVARLIDADRGSIRVFGKELSGLRGKRLYVARRDIGLVYQQFNLVRRLSAIENVLIGQLDHIPTWRVMTRCFSPSQLAQALEHLDRVGLADYATQRADQLSGGQQQRVAIARALMQQSKLILADEPVSSLDPASAESILSLLRSIAKEHGIALLCSLHQTHHVAALADRALAFTHGSLDIADAPVAPASDFPPRFTIDSSLPAQFANQNA